MYKCADNSLAKAILTGCFTVGLFVVVFTIRSGGTRDTEDVFTHVFSLVSLFLPTFFLVFLLLFLGGPILLVFAFLAITLVFLLLLFLSLIRFVRFLGFVFLFVLFISLGGILILLMLSKDERLSGGITRESVRKYQ